MSRRRPDVQLGTAVLAALASPSSVATGAALAADPVLDAAESLLRARGLQGWSVEDAARAAGVGRTSVYRRFPSRDDLVHAVLARELRRTLDAIASAASGARTLEDRAVAAVTAGLDAVEGSVVDSLLRSDPSTFLPYLTTGAGPLLAMARDAICAQVAAATGVPPAPELAEAVARLGLSHVLTRDTVLPADPAERARAVRRVVGPLVQALVRPSRPVAAGA